MVDTGDRENFIALYRAHIGEVYRYIHARCGFDDAAAEDITQDVFLDVLKGLRGFRGLSSERTWIFKIARNKLYDYYRRQYRSPVTCGMEEAENIADIPEAELPFETGCVRSVLTALPPHYRTALVMKYADGESVRQIAGISGLSVKAAESLLTRARVAFMRQYRAMEKEEP